MHEARGSISGIVNWVWLILAMEVEAGLPVAILRLFQNNENFKRTIMGRDRSGGFESRTALGGAAGRAAGLSGFHFSLSYWIGVLFVLAQRVTNPIVIIC